MAGRKTQGTRKKTHYVRSKRRKGSDSAMIAKRSAAIFVLLLFVAFIVFGIVKGFNWTERKLFSANPTFSITNLVVVHNGTRYRENFIRDQLRVSQGDNLFAVSFDELGERLADLPNVDPDQLYFERQLPGTLVASVSERYPVALIGLKRYPRPCCVGSKGFVLSPNFDRSLDTLPTIKGFSETLEPGEKIEHPDIEHVLTIIALCESEPYLHDYIDLKSLDVSYNDYIEIRLVDGARVRMPRYSLENKLFKLASIIDQSKGQGKRVKEVDLTPNVKAGFVDYH